MSDWYKVASTRIFISIVSRTCFCFGTSQSASWKHTQDLNHWMLNTDTQFCHPAAKTSSGHAGSEQNSPPNILFTFAERLPEDGYNSRGYPFLYGTGWLPGGSDCIIHSTPITVSFRQLPTIKYLRVSVKTCVINEIPNDCTILGHPLSRDKVPGTS